LKSDFDVQFENVEAIKIGMKQIVKNDNINSKQITELEQSEGNIIIIINLSYIYRIIELNLSVKGMNMELNNNEDIDPLVLASTDLETKINDIQNNIDKKLRPILTQLNEDGEPSLTIAQDKSIISTI